MQLPSAVVLTRQGLARPSRNDSFHLRTPFTLLLFLAASALYAEPAAMLDIAPQQCSWVAGQTPAWTSPQSDSPAWKPYASWKQGAQAPYVWIRCQFNPAPLATLDHPAAQAHISAAYEVLLNGIHVGANGNMRTGMFTLDFVRTWPIPPSLLRSSSAGPATLEFRILYRYSTVGLLAPAGPIRARVGDETRLKDAKAGEILGQLPSNLLTAGPFTLLGVVGVVLLAIWLPERASRAPILLALGCIFIGLLFFDGMCAAMMLPYHVALYIAPVAVAQAGDAACIVLFYFAVAGRRMPIIVWFMTGVMCFAALLPAIPLLMPAAQALVFDASVIGLSRRVFFLTFGILSLSPFFVFWPYRRIPRGQRLIAVILLFDGPNRALFFFATAYGLSFSTRWVYALFLTNPASSFLAVAALIGIMLRRQRDMVQQRAELSGEMQAAQQIQQTLVTASVETLQPFRIEVAFHPAREVGGDFYLCRVLPGNRQRILIGDVSGKGAAAAMTAAVLLGAAQNREQESPAELLFQLNRVMADMHIGGFATCLCAEIDAHGALCIANAGHLAPYSNDQEIPIQNGLPLGIVAETEYQEGRLQLASGDSLTFVSDGVVEARDPAGDFFGFDRTRAISSRPAREIAAAAQQFGQQDDITVVTLTFTGAPSFA
jgi:hypothetical protein